RVAHLVNVQVGRLDLAPGDPVGVEAPHGGERLHGAAPLLLIGPQNHLGVEAQLRQHLGGVLSDAGPGRRQGREPVQPHVSSLRPTSGHTTPIPPTRPRPRRPHSAASAGAAHNRSSAAASPSGVGSATSPVSSWPTNSSGPPASAAVTTGLLASI